jgi:hypothetical protein
MDAGKAGVISVIISQIKYKEDIEQPDLGLWVLFIRKCPEKSMRHDMECHGTQLTE